MCNRSAATYEVHNFDIGTLFSLPLDQTSLGLWLGKEKHFWYHILVTHALQR